MSISSRRLVGNSRLAGVAYGCEFALPKLYLAPHEMAKEARAVSMDRVSCTAVFEVGTPQSVDPLAWRGSEDETNSTGASSRATSSSSGYYIVWWEDPVDLDVNSVKTSIDWEWDGSCATWSQGTANYWWQSWTGWFKVSSNLSQYPTCSNHQWWANARYENQSFALCSAHSVVDVYYWGVTVQGWNDGWLTGWVDSTYESVTYGACPNLHPHEQLIRTS